MTVEEYDAIMKGAVISILGEKGYAQMVETIRSAEREAMVKEVDAAAKRHADAARRLHLEGQKEPSRLASYAATQIEELASRIRARSETGREG